MYTINCDDSGSYVKFGSTTKSYLVSITVNKITQATIVMIMVKICINKELIERM